MITEIPLDLTPIGVIAVQKNVRDIALLEIRPWRVATPRSSERTE